MQLFRFCLYGFLKNQQYFEPFLILAFREKGLSFMAIGILISFRAVSVNLLEIPSGAIADVWGRRKTMIVCMLGYIVSFIIFAMAENYWLLFPAMFAFAVGEAFRTGTHKAMIFDWLVFCGRQQEKTKIYGITRSWSKIGSALSVIFAAAIVIVSNSYVWIFWISIVPYIINTINLLLYPAFLDGQTGRPRDAGAMLRILIRSLSLCCRGRSLRSLILENICFEGYYSVAKDYLQPLLKAAAISLPVMLSMSNRYRTAILVAVTYVILNLISSFASRKSHTAAKWAGSEYKLSGLILIAALAGYFLTGAGCLAGFSPIPIIGFILLAILLNLWKPIFVSRFYDCADPDSAATTLSIANQSKTLSVAVFAPLLGFMVDRLSVEQLNLYALLPVAVGGIFLSGIGLLLHRRG